MTKILNQMKKNDSEYKSSDMFKVLSVKTRIKIIELLKSKGPLGAKKIAEMVNITPSAASQHLRVLRHAGLVRSKRKGYWIPYTINEEALEKCHQALSKVCKCGFHGPHWFKEGKPMEMDLELLKKYEKELRKEIKTVQKRIKELESET